jgi:hypothetical protein
MWDCVPIVDPRMGGFQAVKGNSIFGAAECPNMCQNHDIMAAVAGVGVACDRAGEA